MHVHFDKNNEYGTIEFTDINREKRSININKDYEIFTYNIDIDTEELIIKIVTGYLKRDQFI